MKESSYDDALELTKIILEKDPTKILTGLNRVQRALDLSEFIKTLKTELDKIDR